MLLECDDNGLHSKGYTNALWKRVLMHVMLFEKLSRSFWQMDGNDFQGERLQLHDPNWSFNKLSRRILYRARNAWVQNSSFLKDFLCTYQINTWFALLKRFAYFCICQGDAQNLRELAVKLQVFLATKPEACSDLFSDSLDIWLANLVWRNARLTIESFKQSKIIVTTYVASDWFYPNERYKKGRIQMHPITLSTSSSLSQTMLHSVLIIRKSPLVPLTPCVRSDRYSQGFSNLASLQTPA